MVRPFIPREGALTGNLLDQSTWETIKQPLPVEPSLEALGEARIELGDARG
jgi:hypothetical protein